MEFDLLFFFQNSKQNKTENRCCDTDTDSDTASNARVGSDSDTV